MMRVCNTGPPLRVSGSTSCGRVWHAHPSCFSFDFNVPDHFVPSRLMRMPLTMPCFNLSPPRRRRRRRRPSSAPTKVYGDPEEHPQRETYWGHVNPIGPRACYDEGKRVAETMMYAYEKQV